MWLPNHVWLPNHAGRTGFTPVSTGFPSRAAAPSGRSRASPNPIAYPRRTSTASGQPSWLPNGANLRGCPTGQNPRGFPTMCGCPTGQTLVASQLCVVAQSRGPHRFQTCVYRIPLARGSAFRPFPRKPESYCLSSSHQYRVGATLVVAQLCVVAQSRGPHRFQTSAFRITPRARQRLPGIPAQAGIQGVRDEDGFRAPARGRTFAGMTFKQTNRPSSSSPAWLSCGHRRKRFGYSPPGCGVGSGTSRMMRLISSSRSSVSVFSGASVGVSVGASVPATLEP